MQLRGGDVEDPPELLELLELAMSRLFLLRGVLDPSQVASDLGMSVSEAMGLRYLALGPSTQQALGSHLGLEKSTVSRLVDAMAAKGWVSKERDARNRRYRSVELTNAGRRAAASVAAAMRDRHMHMLASFSTEERHALTVALPALVRSLPTHPEPNP
jgi:DNA-binding MarR family transcriptional regulator